MILLLREGIQRSKRLPEAKHRGDQQEKGQGIAMSLREGKNFIRGVNRTPAKALGALANIRYSILFWKGGRDAQWIA